MDHKFTEKIGEWLGKDPGARDLMEGAELLLRLTGNRMLYGACRLNPAKYAGHIEYQLQKHYNYRVADLTLHQLKEMKAEAARKAEAIGVNEEPESATEAAAAYRGYGRRPDHEALPQKAREAYAANLEVRRKMQQLHLQIRTKFKEVTNCTASDVYAFVRELLRYEAEYTRNWEIYDNARAELPECKAKEVKDE